MRINLHFHAVNKIIMATVALKRKRTVLTIDEKLTILDSLKEGPSYTIIYENYGIARSTVNDKKMNQNFEVLRKR